MRNEKRLSDVEWPSSCQIKLQSQRDGSRLPVVAAYDSELESNWIAADIAGRLGLKLKTIPKPLMDESRGCRLLSTGQYVNLSTPLGQGPCSEKLRRQFHLIAEPPFQLLLGHK